MPTYGVAITIPDPFGEALGEARRRAGDPMARAIPPHVTLLPPTSIAHEEMEPFVAHLAAVAQVRRPFAMHLSGTGTFRPVSPVVFVQVSAGISHCEDLEQAIRSGPVSRLLDFPYHPHVTIAHHLTEERLEEAFSAYEDFRAAFVVGGFDLYDQGEDQVWRPMRHFELTGEA